MKTAALICCVLLLFGCGAKTENRVNADAEIVKAAPPRNPESVDNGASSGNKAAAPDAEKRTAAEAKGGPRTVRDFFNLLPDKYFTLEGCDRATDPNCDRARAEYVKNYLEVEDTPNGYWKSSCDGAQSCLRMALFKRPDGSYVVGVHTLHEADEINHFLEYKNGAWSDVSKDSVPDFSTAKIYELPRVGTTVQVYKKEFPEKTYSVRGSKIYELAWKDGKFTKK